MKRALVAAVQQPGLDETFQMMAECRRGQIHVRLNLTRRDPLRSTLNDEAQNGEANRMSERTELLGVALDFRGHAATSNKVEPVVNLYFDYFGTACATCASRQARCDFC